MTSMRSFCALTILKSMTPRLMISRRCDSVCAACAIRSAHSRARIAVPHAERQHREGEAFLAQRSIPSSAQVFAAALKRVSKEISRMDKLEARAAHVEAARRALAMRRAAQFPPRPPTGDTASEGMRALPNRRRHTRVPPAKIGSVSQATKNAQAARDARNRSVQ